MSEPDLFDRVAEEVENRGIYRWFGNEPSGEDFAAAYRAEFAQRTCASCIHNVETELHVDYDVITGCAKGVARWSDAASDGFSCSLWTPKASSEVNP